jgi:hypothetical protein
MNPIVLADLATKNGADIRAIYDVIGLIGIEKLVALLPHVAAILDTVQKAQAAK